MLYLNEEAINEALSMTGFMDGIDHAYEIYEQGFFNMPTRLQVQDDKNTLVLMPCFTEDYIGTKLVTVYPSNVDLSKPTIHGLVVLNCNKTGAVKALMDGAFITGIRTGAVGGSAIRHLSRPDVAKLAVIGAGVQGYFQTLAACEARDFKEIYIYDRPSSNSGTELVKKLQKVLDEDITLHLIDNITEAIEQADVIITATNSNEPVLPNEDGLYGGKLVVGVGSFQPTMRELPQALFEVASNVFIDSDDAIKETGDIVVPLKEKWIAKKQVQRMGTYINQQNTTMNKDETVIFKSTGMALFDAVVSSNIYESAISKGVGVKLT